MVCGVVQFHLYLDKWIYTVYIVYLNYLSMLEQATFLSLKLEFEIMVMSMLIINPVFEPPDEAHSRGHVLGCCSSTRWPTELYLVSFNPASRDESNGTTWATFHQHLAEWDPKYVTIFNQSWMKMSKVRFWIDAITWAYLRPLNWLRAYCNPLKEPNVTYKGNIFKLLFKIVN